MEVDTGIEEDSIIVEPVEEPFEVPEPEPEKKPVEEPIVVPEPEKVPAGGVMR